MAQPLDPTTLRLFLAVVEERSMAKAAERERITTPAISKRIAYHEAQLDVKLLERSNIGVRPTAAGR
jgi:DNA-binding transcriptional LysR family regulator